MRFNLFTKKTVQYHYLILIATAMIVPALIVGTFLYYFIFTLTAEHLGMPESIAENLIPVLNRINLMLFAGLVPFFCLVLLVGLVLSNRFYGPLCRIEKSIDEIINGNINAKLHVRKDDDIKAVVDKINLLLDMMRAKTK